MSNGVKRVALKPKYLPILLEKGQDGFYVAECTALSGCYAQGKTIDAALKNIREVIDLILEEESARKALAAYNPLEVSLHAISL